MVFVLRKRTYDPQAKSSSWIPERFCDRINICLFPSGRDERSTGVAPCIMLYNLVFNKKLYCGNFVIQTR